MQGCVTDNRLSNRDRAFSTLRCRATGTDANLQTNKLMDGKIHIRSMFQR